MIALLLVFSVSFACFCETSFTPQEKIKIYRDILKQEKDPATLAETHFKIAELLEGLDRDTEATSEYLKIILNYPQEKELARKSEERLNVLYEKFQATDNEPGYDKYIEPTKDPTIFFTYIRSLYETYSSKGNYDKSVQLLEKLIKIHPKNVEYYIDLGAIYLDGYGQPDKALVYFEKVNEMDPDNARILTYIGLAYEKKQDYDKALQSYMQSVDNAPLDAWNMYAIKRMEGLKLARKKKLVKDWYFLGPFDDAGQKAIDDDEINPKSLVPGKSYDTEDGKSIQWERPFLYDDSGYVDLNALYGKDDHVYCYVLSHAYSDRPRDILVKVGTDDSYMLWINDSLLSKKKIQRQASIDEDVIKVHIDKGWNKILLKLFENTGSWGFYFRITDMHGNTPLNVIFDPTKNEKRAKSIYSMLSKQKNIRIAKNTFFFGFTLIILVAGFYLLISNIYTSIKIRQMKEDFIASVSHELKTPLAAIKMFTETLSMGRVSKKAEVADYYQTIIRETDRLTRFINKILDFQKIEKGKKIYSFDSVDIKDLVKNAVGIYRDQIQDENFIVEENYEKDLPSIEVDEDAMLQVFLNLLTNAYKYSLEEKYAKVEVYKKDDKLYVSVGDKGIGISKDKITKIFHKFYRVGGSVTRDVKGSGIGLAFVKDVVEAHKGKIAVESEPKKGSRFIISLPIEREV